MQIDVSTEDLGSISLRGLSYSGKQHIKINELLESTQYLSTLNHEIGHQLMHNDSKKPVSVKEFEADAFSMMLDWHMGIEVLDTRKIHFVESYDSLRQQPDFKNMEFEDLFSDVFATYSANAEKLDMRVQPYIAKDMAPKRRHREISVEH